MTQKTNLRFLLALGNHKLIVIEDQEEVNIYSSTKSSREKPRVDAKRIGQALLTR